MGTECIQFVRLQDLDIKANVGNRLYVVGLVTGVEVRPTRAGGESIIFNIIDNDEKREVRVFDNIDVVKTKLANGQVYDLIIDIKPYDKGADGISCILYDIRYTRTGITPEKFRPHIENIEFYEQKLMGYLAYYGNTVYSAIALTMYKEVAEKFRIHPAGSSMHHTEMGGLLFHSCAVADKCYSDCMVYNGIYGENFVNDALTVCTALIHDIGKLEEFIVKEDYTVEYTPESALTNHLVMGENRIKETAYRLGYGNIREVKEMCHLILSHHGKLEYGSPVEPHSMEAIILAEADLNDAKAWRFRRAISKMKAGESVCTWARGSSEVWYRATTKEEHLLRISNGFQDIEQSAIESQPATAQIAEQQPQIESQPQQAIEYSGEQYQQNAGVYAGVIDETMPFNQN